MPILRVAQRPKRRRPAALPVFQILAQPVPRLDIATVGPVAEGDDVAGQCYRAHRPGVVVRRRSRRAVDGEEVSKRLDGRTREEGDEDLLPQRHEEGGGAQG